MKNQTFVCVTRWNAGPDETFERRHVRVARSRSAAMAAERSHNTATLRDGMAAEGWRARVVSCVVSSDVHERALVALDWHLARARRYFASADANPIGASRVDALHDIMTCNVARDAVRQGAA